LERIITASSNPGDVVLDPFCGCGTAVHAAQKLGRKWIGIDITHPAITLIEKRMQSAFRGKQRAQFEVFGQPKDLEAARDLVLREKGRRQYEWWAISLVPDAKAYQGKKYGADTGVDGIRYFYDLKDPAPKKLIISVKSGDNVGVGMIRDLRGAMEREKADFAVLITLTPPTTPMIKEASAAGLHRDEAGRSFARVQILTIEGLLNQTQRAEHPDYVKNANFKKAKREAQIDISDLFGDTAD
jgi:site-specific DNA-methyltransferase (adenine-specific)